MPGAKGGVWGGLSLFLARRRSPRGRTELDCSYRKRGNLRDARKEEEKKPFTSTHLKEENSTQQL